MNYNIIPQEREKSEMVFHLMTIVFDRKIDYNKCNDLERGALAW